MKKICESPFNGWGESAERIYVYALRSEDERDYLNEMSHEERCEYFDVCDQSGYYVAPGALYHTYAFHIHSNHVVVREYVAYNV